MFQSPSLRGSGRFDFRHNCSPGRGCCFNPLHCGAVVASVFRRAEELGLTALSQSPSLRGSGRFVTEGRKRSATRCLNPLHCGAVVASVFRRAEELGLTALSQSPSLRGSGRFTKSFLPSAGGAEVSIPFIAGQWSLRAQRGCGAARRPRLNPLHCGAVVASVVFDLARILGQYGLNPLHCRAVVASSVVAALPADLAESQSPSLRGSGRFAPCARRRSPSPSRLNPLHCGAVVASLPDGHIPVPDWCLNPLHCGAVVASCGQSGTGSVRVSAGRLNPLHCGAVVASP